MQLGNCVENYPFLLFFTYEIRLFKIFGRVFPILGTPERIDNFN